MTKSLIYLALFVCCANVIAVLGDCDIFDKYFFIRNKSSGLVLDATDGRKGVKIQPYNASNTNQRFQLKAASRTGLFNIFRPSPLNDTLEYTPLGEGENQSNLTIGSSYTASIYKQWFLNSDGTILNAGLIKHGIMVDQSPFYTGNYVIVAASGNFGVDQQWQLTNVNPPE